MIIAYFTIAFVVAACAVEISWLTYEDDHETGRAAARVALLCLFWPALAVYGLVRLIPALMRRADWGAR